MGGRGVLEPELITLPRRSIWSCRNFLEQVLSSSQDFSYVVYRDNIKKMFPASNRDVN